MREQVSMGRRALLVIAAGCVALLGSGRVARADDAAAKPKLVVEQEEIDLGTREAVPKIEFVFQLKNTGAAPLQISEVKPSCGCVVPKFDHEIAPGGSSTITGTLAAEALRGAVMKTLTVLSNDPERPAVMLTLKATLRQMIEVEPALDLLFVLRQGKSPEQTVTIRSFETAPLQIVKVESSEPYLKAEALPEEPASSEDTANASTHRRVRISVLPGAPVAMFNGIVTLHTTSTHRPQITLNVSGYPEDAVTVSPPRIYFAGIPTTPSPVAPVDRFVSLMKTQGSFKVLGAEADPALRVTFAGDADGHFYQLIIRYLGGWKPGPLQGLIIVKTSDPSRPRIEIPYSGQVAP